MTKPPLRVGLIGSGFMGKTHIFGFATAARVFDLPYEIRLECIADATPELARSAMARFGFCRYAKSWEELAADPDIDVLDITAPNAFHRDMAIAGAASGKHIYCEKPIATSAADAADMVAAVDAADVKSQVGFNYISNPMFRLAKEIIESGSIGEVRTFRGVHAEDYMADADSPWTWRHDINGGGATADLGSHVLATAEYLTGPIVRVCGDLHTAIGTRQTASGEQAPVHVDDVGRAFLRFENGASGSLEANWLASGQKMQHAFEIYCSRGSIAFDQTRLNELKLHEADSDPKATGFRTILAGPEHVPYGEFCVAPGHQLGYNDLKAIEIKGFIEAIAGLGPERFNLAAGMRVQQLVETIQNSARLGEWIDVK